MLADTCVDKAARLRARAVCWIQARTRRSLVSSGKANPREHALSISPAQSRSHHTPTRNMHVRPHHSTLQPIGFGLLASIMSRSKIRKRRRRAMIPFRMMFMICVCFPISHTYNSFLGHQYLNHKTSPIRKRRCPPPSAGIAWASSQGRAHNCTAETAQRRGARLAETAGDIQQATHLQRPSLHSNTYPPSSG